MLLVTYRRHPNSKPISSIYFPLRIAVSLMGKLQPTSSKYCPLRIIVSLIVSQLLADIIRYYRCQPNSIIVSIIVNPLLADFANYISSSYSCVSSSPLDMNQETSIIQYTSMKMWRKCCWNYQNIFQFMPRWRRMNIHCISLMYFKTIVIKYINYGGKVYSWNAFNNFILKLYKTIYVVFVSGLGKYTKSCWLTVSSAS